MTAISSIFDALVDVCEATLTTHKRLPNPYLVETNNELFLSKGFGVAFGPGAIERLQVCNKIQHRRLFTVVVTRLVSTTDINTTARETIEKNLIEDYIALRIALEQNHTLSGNCIDITYTDDTGVNYAVVNDLQRYVTMEVTLSVLYEETLP